MACAIAIEYVSPYWSLSMIERTPPYLLNSMPRVSMQRKICVFRALHLGEMLCAVPALRALRAAAPQAQISLIGLPWSVSFARRFSRYVDEHLVFPGYPGLPESIPQLHLVPNFISIVQQRRFDLILQMHGNGSISNPLIALFDAAFYAGYYRHGEYCPDPRRFYPWDERQHEVLRNVQLMKFLGVETKGHALEFPLLEADFRALRRCPAIPPKPGSYVCILPGASSAERRWPAERFAEVADRLSAAGWRIVLTGSVADCAVSRAVMQAMRSPCLDLTGKTDLGACAALISRARLVICNDTGVAQMAVALETPSVIISGSRHAQRRAPLNSRRHCLVHAGRSASALELLTPAQEPSAVGNILTSVVMTAVDRMLSTGAVCMH